MSPEAVEHPPVGATQVAISAPGIRASAAVAADAAPGIRAGAAVAAESRFASLPRARRRPRGFLPGAAASRGRDAGADIRERSLRSDVLGHYKSERNEVTSAARPPRHLPRRPRRRQGDPVR